MSIWLQQVLPIVFASSPIAHLGVVQLNGGPRKWFEEVIIEYLIYGHLLPEKNYSTIVINKQFNIHL